MELKSSSIHSCLQEKVIEHLRVMSSSVVSYLKESRVTLTGVVGVAIDKWSGDCQSNSDVQGYRDIYIYREEV